MVQELFVFKEWHADEIDDHTIERCAQLFSGHYAKWGQNARWGQHKLRPGESVKLTSALLKSYYLFDKSRCFLVTAETKTGELIGQFFGCTFNFDNGKGVGVWGTQLVVHKDFRRRGVATQLLKRCIDKGNAAWGCATSNPIVVRILEHATGKLCDPKAIGFYADMLIKEGGVPYAQNKKFTIDAGQSLIHTEFFIDHTGFEIDKMVAEQTDWRLGSLKEGDEFFAFTFADDVLTKSV